MADLLVSESVDVDVPHVAGIDEHGAMEIAKERHAVFQIGDELRLSVTEHVVELAVLHVKIVQASGADLPDAEGADAVGTTGIEQLAEGRIDAVTIAPDDTGIQMTHQLGCRAERPGLGEVGLQSEELGVGRLEELLAFLVE